MTYEMHLTVTPPVDDGPSYEEFVAINSMLGWKASMFDHDDVDGIAGKWFLTSHAVSEARAIAALRAIAHGIECSGMTVERAKVERVVFDTKTGDTL